MEVSRSNRFVESEEGNAIVVGILSMAMLVALEAAVTKVHFKSRTKSTDMIFRKEIFARLSSFRSLWELLSGFDFRKKELFLHNNQDGFDGELQKRTIHPRRLIMPLVCRVLLLTVEITVLVLSGQRLVSDGGLQQNAYTLIPADSSSPFTLDRRCRNDLHRVRAEVASGVLETCTSIVRKEGFSQIRDGAVLSVDRRYLTNTITFSVVTAGSTSGENRALSVSSKYRSYDGFEQTLTPFDDMPAGDSGRGHELSSDPTIGSRFRLETLNQIYDILVAELMVPEDNQTENFPEGREAGLGIGNRYYEASFAGEFDQDHIIDVLSNIILQKFTLAPQHDKKLVSFDEKLGLDGPEMGAGAKLRASNVVPNWV